MVKLWNFKKLCISLSGFYEENYSSHAKNILLGNQDFRVLL